MKLSLPSLPQPTTQPQHAAGPNPMAPPEQAEPPNYALNSRIRTRQPRWVWLAGVALIVVAILGAVWLVNNLRDTTTVLTLNKSVQQGHEITADDLSSVTINTDSGLSAIPLTQQGDVIGKVAAVPLSEGSVLNPKDVTVGLIPAEGQTLVGVTVSYDKMPAEPLVAGDLIRLVDTPRDQDDSPSQGPITTNAQVVSTKDIPEQRQTTVDVLVPKAEASWVSARAATHRVAIILDTRER